MKALRNRASSSGLSLCATYRILHCLRQFWIVLREQILVFFKREEYRCFPQCLLLIPLGVLHPAREVAPEVGLL